MKQAKLEIPKCEHRALGDITRKAHNLLKERTATYRAIGTYDNERVLNLLIDMAEKAQGLVNHATRATDKRKFDEERAKVLEFVWGAYLQCQNSKLYQEVCTPTRAATRKDMPGHAPTISIEGSPSLQRKLAEHISDGASAPLPSLDVSDASMTFDVEEVES